MNMSILSSPRRPTISAFVTANIPTGKIDNRICVVRGMGRADSANFEAGRLVFSEHRLGAIQSDVAARDRDGTARTVCSAKHDSLDQVDHDRRSTRRSSILRPLQADQLEAISKRLPRIRFSFHDRRQGRQSIGSRSVFRIRTRATLRAGRTHAGAICAAAAIPGSFLMKRFSVARRSGRIRRRFRSRSRRIASSCTASRACRRCSIRFSALEIQRWPRNAAA